MIHNGKKLLKSESTKHVPTQTDNSNRKYRTLSTGIIEMKIVESFEKHSIFLLLPFIFIRIG